MVSTSVLMVLVSEYLRDIAGTSSSLVANVTRVVCNKAILEFTNCPKTSFPAFQIPVLQLIYSDNDDLVFFIVFSTSPACYIHCIT